MINKSLTGLTLAAACLIGVATMPTARAENMTGDTQLITNGPQSDGTEASGTWSPQRNVRESNQYEALLHQNPGFRATRIQKECGSIDDAALHAQCVSSFGADGGPAVRHHYRHQVATHQGD